MRTQQTGFTLIEMVMVIVILGILAATAIPTFINLSQDANQAATDGFAGALASGSAINFAARSANVANGIAITDCNLLGGTLQGGLPAGYSIGAGPIANGATATCTLTGPGTPATTKTFTGHGISP